ncbi:MAG: protein-methionine-sulfoxide reductase catalytic subunit MsrP [Dokdonella sp.]
MSRFRIPTIPPSEITSEFVYRQRRQLLKGLALAAPVRLLVACGDKSGSNAKPIVEAPPTFGQPLVAQANPTFVVGDPRTTAEDATHYNNYYEFGTEKSDPARNSAAFQPLPWSVEIAGNAEVTGSFTLEDVLAIAPQEERVYRLRCVEGWSMVIPWIGIPLAKVLAHFKPTSAAKFVTFTTAERPAQMPGISYRVLDWPYREALRIDEAMNPVSLLVTGMYGRTLPAQNGAPLRLMTPWKYGFKSSKSIVRIEFVEQKPITSWNDSAPDEYGFYANVNPAVDHPRWSQASERRIAGDGRNLLNNRVVTLPFNGYTEQVASMYAGMDLSKNF